MRRTSGLLLGLTLCAGVAFLCAACTFPSVDYEDPPAISTAETLPCVVPQTCAPAVSTCGKKAETQRGSCLKKCSNGQSADCMTCQSAHDSALTACTEQCKSCSASNGCANATESCMALLGL